jgi:hypothetical protein
VCGNTWINLGVHILTEEYAFPEAYVEDVEGQRYLCLENDVFTVISSAINFDRCVRRFGLIPYEQVLNYIDLVDAKTKSSIAVLRENMREKIYQGYIIEKDTHVCIQEITGNTIFVLAKEGISIKKDASIAYVVTNKLEVRNIKSMCEGLITLIVDLPWEEPRKTILVVPSVYRSITARKST